jgi:hypothetical protein
MRHWLALPFTLTITLAPHTAFANGLSFACIAEAQALVSPPPSQRPTELGPPLQLATAEATTRLRASGLQHGPLRFGSLVSPPSTLTLIELPTQADEPGVDCPLHRLYVAFQQGGLVLQAAKYFGPLKASEVLTLPRRPSTAS